MQTLESLLKKGTTILKDNGLEEAGWMPGSFWNLRPERIGHIILRMEMNRCLMRPQQSILR